MNTTITSRQNGLVKLMRELRNKNVREQEKVYLLEGPKAIGEAISLGVRPQKVVVSEGAVSMPSLYKILSQAPEVVTVSDSVMAYISETETPPGIIAFFGMRMDRLEGLPISKAALLVVLDGIQDPGNVGTIIRTADAFAAAGVILTKGCADLYNAKVLRSTMGSVFHLPIVRDVDPAELPGFFENNRVRTLVTSLDPKAVPVSEAGYGQGPLAVVLGSEARGVSPILKKGADIEVKIATPGLAESLNVAVAAGIVLFEAVTARPLRPDSNL